MFHNLLLTVESPIVSFEIALSFSMLYSSFLLEEFDEAAANNILKLGAQSESIIEGPALIICPFFIVH